MAQKGKVRRKVISYEFYSPKYAPLGTGRYVWKLECGHERCEKASVPIPRKTSCDECQQDLELFDEVRAR